MWVKKENIVVVDYVIERISNIIHTESKNKCSTIKIIKSNMRVNLFIMVTYYIGACLKCYEWPWTHFYSMVDLTQSEKIEHLLITWENDHKYYKSQ